MVAALNSPIPTLADVAWLFRDLGRESEFSNAVVDTNPIKGPWNDAARAIGDGDLARAADIIETIGHTAAAGYARLRAAEAFTTAGRQAEAAAQRAEAEPFYRKAGAAGFVRRLEVPGSASAGNQRASSRP